MANPINEEFLLNEFLTSLGLWSNYVVIGGGYALIIYRQYLANLKNSNPPVGTRDIDSLICRTVPKISDKSIAKHLQEAGYAQTFKDFGSPPTESYIKEVNGVEIEIEFLTDDRTRKDKDKNIAIAGAGITAQQLTYLTMSLENPRGFNTFSGTAGQVVAPGAWMFHKGLTFPKRNDKIKKYKDLYGIWYVCTQLGEFSQTAINELKSLSTQYPAWFKTFRTNLHKWLKSASPIDWINLENQDPYGALKKEHFEESLKAVLNHQSFLAKNGVK